MRYGMKLHSLWVICNPYLSYLQDNELLPGLLGLEAAAASYTSKLPMLLSSKLFLLLLLQSECLLDFNLVGTVMSFV